MLPYEGFAAEALAGKSVIVTGGGSGIGRAVATDLVARGARVTISGRNEDALDAVAAELGPSLQAVRSDLTDASDRLRLVTQARSHGRGAIYAVVNCAADLVVGGINAFDPSTALRLFDNNVVSALALVSLAVTDLEQTEGVVVLFSSSHTRRPSPNLATYAASKGAVEAATTALAVELGGRNIRVNCVRPGAVPSAILERSGVASAAARERLESLIPRHVLRRLGDPADVARGVAFLLSATWMTGVILPVDGGYGLGA